MGKGFHPVQPIKPPKPRRTAVLRVRLTTHEREAIDAAARRAGIGPCSFVRVTAVSAVAMTPTPPPRRKRQPSVVARSMAKFLGALNQIGNNLNQCARGVNTGFVINPKTLDEIRDELRRLREVIIADQEGRPS